MSEAVQKQVKTKTTIKVYLALSALSCVGLLIKRCTRSAGPLEGIPIRGRCLELYDQERRHEVGRRRGQAVGVFVKAVLRRADVSSLLCLLARCRLQCGQCHG